MNVDRRATRWRSPDEPCLNCGDTTPGRFCPSCGQRKAEVLVSVRALIADVLEDQLVLNRALPRTLNALLFHPGKLTEEYVRGRIVRYIAPFRLYLVSSVVFFLILSFFGLQRFDVNQNGETDPTIAPDSAAVADSQEALAGIDTTAMPEAARAAVREAMAEAAAGIAAARDSVAAQNTDAADGLPVQDSIAADDSADAQDDDSAEDDRVAQDVPQSPGVMQPWARSVEVNTNWPLLDRAMERKIAQVGHLPPRDALREILRDLLEYAPHMIFLLLPIFALLLKLLYVRRRRYYAEHFVFALHVHAFVFTIFIVMFVLPWNQVDGFLMLWIVAYVWLALRRVYRQGWVRTTVKWWTLGWMYFWVLLVGVVGLAFATLLFT